MKKDYEIVLAHLYPQDLNLYGDIGNIITIKKRCEWRGIKVKLINYEIGKKFPKADIYFIGGGQDYDEILVSRDIIKQKDEIKNFVKNNKVFLCICAGMQLFGKYFVNGEGKKIEGLGVVNIVTISQGKHVKSRCIGNILIKLNPKVFPIEKFQFSTAVGFENHSGQTYLGKNIAPLGFVIKGKGNNIKDKIEGAVFKNVYCSYMHGPLLPKNPHIADFLIQKALKTKYGKNIALKPIDDYDEKRAHEDIVNRLLR